MEIRNMDPCKARTVERSQEKGPPAVEEKGSTGKEAAAVETDKVRLSRGYRDMAQMKKLIADKEEVRSDRVSQLRELLEKNAYDVSPEDIAKEIVEQLW